MRGLKGGLVAALLLSILAPAVAIFATAAQNPVYARVNDEAVTARDVRERIAIYQLADPTRATALGTRASVPSIVERLINERLLLAAAKKAGVQANHVDRGVGPTAVTSPLLRDIYGSGPALQEAEGRLGTSPAGVRRYAAAEATIAEFLRQRFPLRPPTEEAVGAYYRAHTRDFRTPSMVKLRQLTFATKAAAQKAGALLARGGTWEAAKLSGGRETAAMSGWMVASALKPAVQRATGALPKGRPSGIVREGAGYAIVEVLGREPSRQLTETEAAPGIRAYLEGRDDAGRVAAYVKSLRAGARVVLSLPRGA